MTEIVCEPLTLDHQGILYPLWKALCQKNQIQYSEYSFANNFLFRRSHNYAFINSDPPFLRGEYKPNSYYYIPTCAPGQINSRLLKCLAAKSTSLFPIPDIWLPELQKCHPTVSTCRAESDYLYTAEKMKTLSGRDLSSRRNLLHQLLKNYKMETRVLDHSQFDSAREVLDSWQKNSGQPKEKTDYFACRDSLAYMEKLELFGRITYADGQPVGYTIGELLLPTTALLHFAKSLHAFKGITPYLYQDFALHLPESVQWINLEQDLGLTTLRKAKEAFAPDRLLAKWRVEFNGLDLCQ